MKRLLILAMATVFACCVATQAQAQEKKQDPKTEEITFLTNIDCANCAKKISDKLPFEKGIKDMKVDVDKKTVWIKFQPQKTNKATLQKAIEKIGYTAEEVKPEADNEA